MKTKEIDVWVSIENIDKNNTNLDVRQRQYYTPISGVFLKAKLIIELPEQKKEFTPSDIRKAWNKAFDNTENDSDGVYLKDALKELFGEDA